MLWKIPLGYGILNLVAHMAIEAPQFFFKTIELHGHGNKF